MAAPHNPLSLADWRRQVAELYAQIRQIPNPQIAWQAYRRKRDTLFQTHPQTPLNSAQGADFSELSYFDYDPAWRIMGRLDTRVDRETFQVDLPDDGPFTYTRIAYVHFGAKSQSVQLSLFWINGYGGGLFLPFRDQTNSQTTYGGGRYLYDSIKGADLSSTLNFTSAEFILDFNFAYNPSCAYNEQWVCPLSPPENRLPLAIEAGEKAFLL